MTTEEAFFKMDTLVPIQQAYCNMEFRIFKEPKATKTGNKCYGLWKFKGAHMSKSVAETEAENSIKKGEFVGSIKCRPSGMWHPIMDAVEGELMIDVSDKNSESKEKNLELRTKAAYEKKEEQERIIREIRENEKLLKDDSMHDPETLNYFTMKRVTEKELSENAAILRNKLLDIEEKLNMTREIIYTSSVAHPDYDSQWVYNYNNSPMGRKASGLPDYIHSDRLVKEYNEWVSKFHPQVTTTEEQVTTTEEQVTTTEEQVTTTEV